MMSQTPSCSASSVMLSSGSWRLPHCTTTPEPLLMHKRELSFSLLMHFQNKLVALLSPHACVHVSECRQQLISLIFLQLGDGWGQGQLRLWHSGHTCITSPAKPAADGANPTTRGEEGEHAVKELCQQPGRASTWIQARRRGDPRCPPGAIPRTQPKHTKAPEEPQREKSQFPFDSFNWGCLFINCSDS